MAMKPGFAERVMRDLGNMFPSPEPDKHRYIIEKDRFAFYLYDSRPVEATPGEWTRTPVAKLSYLETDRLWQVSWMPPQGRWQKYGRYFDLDTASVIIKGDPGGCFTGVVSPMGYLRNKPVPEAPQS